MCTYVVAGTRLVRTIVYAMSDANCVHHHNGQVHMILLLNIVRSRCDIAWQGMRHAIAVAHGNVDMS